jgi:putative FmdB family regulatory protein
VPTYEYRCDACGHEFEIEQRITADKLKKCPKCKKMKLVRLVGTGNFILKGGGWYADLYSGKSNVKGGDEKSSESGSSSDSSTSDAKKDSGKKKSKKPKKKD